ncbi:MAG: GNAT family N-acetyltransferase [Ruminococcus sp.]|nr:GNAT family N-acetyltransferase [Ruminococcus sp.]
MEIKVRRADISDAQTVCALMLKLAEFENLQDKFTASPRAVAEMMNEPNGLRGVIAEADGKTAGMAVYNFYKLASFSGKRVMYIEDIFVAEEYRGMGIGKMIFDELILAAKGSGCIKIEWKCLEWNMSARAFYEKAGASAGGGWLTYTLDLRE